MKGNAKIVVMTGAGISAESGLGTFRDAGGVWTQHDFRDVATPEGFARDPVRVHDFYNQRRANAARARPNAAHIALARLKRDHPGEVVIVTQNVDGLHEAAGAEAIHMHGQLHRASCHVCRATWTAPEVMAASDPCPECGVQATRPDVVWFGETPKHMETIAGHLTESDVFAVIGTSGTVWPAAGFAEIASEQGAETVELNLAPTPLTPICDRAIHGPATRTVPLWVEELLA
jgi:NAD-dependent deacetylase